MSISRFRVYGSFDTGGSAQVATVEIDRSTNIMSVRPLRRRRKYELPLSTVAGLICKTLIMAEVREKRAAKLAKRKKKAS
jgi:hypothetical protein